MHDFFFKKKVHVTANYGYAIFDKSMTTNDFLGCCNQTLKTIEFHISEGSVHINMIF